MEDKRIQKDAREAQALNDEELDTISGGTDGPSLQKPKILSGDELDELLGGSQAIDGLNTGSNTFTVL